MIFDLITLAEQVPVTGDSFPVKVCLTIVGIAAVILIVTTIISKKKK